MRAVFLLILLIGVGIGIIYPWAITNFSGREIGTWRVYERGSEFRPVTAKLGSSDEPVRVLVDMTAIAPPEFAPRATALTITASRGNRTVLAETLNFSESKPQDTSPQLREKVYRDEAGVITGVEDGDYVFVVGPGDAEGIEMRSVDLILRGGAGAYDERMQPLGYSLMAIGFIGLVLALRRGGSRPQNPNSQPPPPRWGRGGGQPS